MPVKVLFWRVRNMKSVLRLIASLRLTTVGMVMLGVGGFVVSKEITGSSWLVVLPLLLLAMNLLAALIINPIFRARPALFGMHIGLMLLVIALAIGQLTRYRGHFEISEGQAFDPETVIVDRTGYIKPVLPQEGTFRQGKVHVNYAPGVVRRETVSHVVLIDGQLMESTDGQPLIINGYRFYLTHNKGFSAILSWQGSTAPAFYQGAVHFPSYPRLAPNQTTRWITPHGTPLELKIEPHNHPQKTAWKLDNSMAGDRLMVRVNGDEGIALTPGQDLNLPGGRLHLIGFRFWIGYRVFYDPTLFWVFSCATITLIFLAILILSKFYRPVVYDRQVTAAVKKVSS